MIRRATHTVSSASAFLLLTLLASCASPPAARLLVPDAPVFVHGPAGMRLPVQVTAVDGRVLERVPLRTSMRGDTAVRVSDGVISCTGRGDAEVTVSTASLEARFAVRCRPITGFAIAPPMELFVGGPAVPLEIRPVGNTGEVLAEWHARGAVSDTTVLQLRNGMLYPRRLGSTTLELDFGGVKRRVALAVNERVLDELLSLAPDEYRAYTLPVGRYFARLTSLGELPARPQWLRSNRAVCAHDSHASQAIHCRLESRGAIVVHRPPEAEPAPGPLRLVVIRKPN